jgi:hypothetical protein
LYFSSTPVFGEADRIAAGGGGGDDGVPAELKGKTPAEIARYYQNRETMLRAELTPKPPPPKKDEPPPDPTAAEFWNDPAKSTQRMMAKALTKEEFERLAGSLRPSMIWAAKEQCRQTHADFDRIKVEIDQLMKNVPEWQQTDPVMWETTYTYAKGQAHDRLAAEDRAKPPVQQTSERVQPGSVNAPPDVNLNTVTLPGLLPKHTAAHVADNLGVSHDQYRKAAKELEGDGRLPLTYDTRGKR